MFRFVRKYMTEAQFLKSVTANYYSTVFYGASVWLPNIKAKHKLRLNSLHFRLLRTACKDFNQLISRENFTMRCNRATPTEWSKYVTASIAIRTIRDKKPKELHEILKRTYFEERRFKGRGLFYDSSKTRPGRQSIQNLLQHVYQIRNPWNELGSKMTNDAIRVLLKNNYFICKTIPNVSVGQIIE